MARARTLKPSFFKNEKVVARSFPARLLYEGLWTLADRRGILKDKPQWIKMEVFPADSLDVNALLGELAERREDEDCPLIRRYERHGFKCIIICGFAQHNHPHPNEQANDLPMPGSSACAEVVVNASDATDIGINREHSGKAASNPSLSPLPITLSPIPTPCVSTQTATAPEKELPWFDRWWREWPPGGRKKGKADSRRKWLRAKLEPLGEEIVSALRRCKVSRDWTKNDGEFIPLPMTWLNQTPWETDPAEQVGTTPEPSAPEGANGEYRDPTDEDIAEYRKAVAP